MNFQVISNETGNEVCKMTFDVSPVAGGKVYMTATTYGRIEKVENGKIYIKKVIHY